MNISGIYQIQSKIKPERIYIGSAICIEKRWWCHRTALRKNKHCSLKLQRHFNKYGESDLQFSILLGCDNNKEYLLKNEQFFIDSYNPYFNNAKIAGSCLGVKHSIETCKRNSEAQKGKKLSEETKRKIGLAHLGKELPRGRKLSKEHIQRIRESNLGNKYNEGRILSEEHKLNISIANTGMKRSEQARKNIRDAVRRKGKGQKHLAYILENIKYKKQKEIAKELNIDASTVCKLLKKCA